MKIDQKTSDKYLKILGENGFQIEYEPGNYILWRAKNSEFTLTCYTSFSLLIQGKGEFTLFNENLESNVKPHYGADEVGKGDYFGPLVVVGVYLDLDLSEYGIKDSKKLNDEKMVKIFNSLKDKVKYEAQIITPKKYNEGINKYNNVSIFLSEVHGTVAKLLREKVGVNTQYVVDQFSSNKGRLITAFKGVEVELVQFHKGESDLAVALASVFARAIFVNEFEKMNEEYGLIFPKGATDVISFGKEFIKMYGVEKLREVAKISFKTSSSIISPL